MSDDGKPPEPNPELGNSLLSRFLVGCTFMMSVAIVMFMAFGVVLGVSITIDQGHSANGPRAAPLVAVIVLVCGAIIAFFAMVAKRLYSAWRGQKVPHLVPPWLAVPLSFGLGAGSVAVLFSPHAHAGDVYVAGTGLIFLGYSFRTAWNWLRKTRN